MAERERGERRGKGEGRGFRRRGMGRRKVCRLRGLAVEASPKNLRTLEHHKRVIAAKADREHKSAEATASRLSGVKLLVRARAGEEGRLFGSVTDMDVERLLAEKGFHVERRRILLPEPIKQLGTFPIPVQVGRSVRVSVELTVEAEPG